MSLLLSVMMDIPQKEAVTKALAVDVTVLLK